MFDRGVSRTLRFSAAERRGTRLRFGAISAHRKLLQPALPDPAASLPATALSPLSTLQITPFSTSQPRLRLPITQSCPIAPYRCANAAQGIAANSVVMARLDRAIQKNPMHSVCYWMAGSCPAMTAGVRSLFHTLLLRNGVEETRQAPGGRNNAAEPRQTLARACLLFVLPSSRWPLTHVAQAFPCK